MDLYAITEHLPDLLAEPGSSNSDDTLAASIALLNSSMASIVTRHSAARILNDAGAFVSPVPTSALPFPFAKGSLPATFSSVNWTLAAEISTSGAPATAGPLPCLWLNGEVVLPCCTCPAALVVIARC